MSGAAVDRGRVRIGPRAVVSLQRTLRIPDDGRVYPLPPGLGALPARRVSELGARSPRGWRVRGAYFVPLYPWEALWLGFEGAGWKPNAVKVGIGSVNAVSGEVWDKTLHDNPQDYVVCPTQPWLDGINAGAGVIRQFVAMPLGMGYTVEQQVTGSEREGGIQFVVFEPHPGLFADRPPQRSPSAGPLFAAMLESGGAMGMAAGGTIRQKIYPDPYGIGAWNPTKTRTTRVYLVSSARYRELTGADPPPSLISARTYTEHGLPWFEVSDVAMGDVAAPRTLRDVRSATDLAREHGAAVAEEQSVDVPPEQVRQLPHPGPQPPPRRHAT